MSRTHAILCRRNGRGCQDVVTTEPPAAAHNHQYTIVGQDLHRRGGQWWRYAVGRCECGTLAHRAREPHPVPTGQLPAVLPACLVSRLDNGNRGDAA